MLSMNPVILKSLRQTAVGSVVKVRLFLMVSETAIIAGSKLKRDHDTIKGIINGYFEFRCGKLIQN